MVDDSFYWWLAGLIDGEGCITPGDKLYQKIQKENGYKFSQRTFSISISNTNLSMLTYIKENLGTGGIYKVNGNPTIKEKIAKD